MLAALSPAQPEAAAEALSHMLEAALQAGLPPPEDLIGLLAEALCTAACATE